MSNDSTEHIAKFVVEIADEIASFPIEKLWILFITLLYSSQINFKKQFQLDVLLTLIEKHPLSTTKEDALIDSNLLLQEIEMQKKQAVLLLRAILNSNPHSLIHFLLFGVASDHNSNDGVITLSQTDLQGLGWLQELKQLTPFKNSQDEIELSICAFDGWTIVGGKPSGPDTPYPVANITTLSSENQESSIIGTLFNTGAVKWTNGTFSEIS